MKSNVRNWLVVGLIGWGVSTAQACGCGMASCSMDSAPTQIDWTVALGLNAQQKQAFNQALAGHQSKIAELQKAHDGVLTQLKMSLVKKNLDAGALQALEGRLRDSELAIIQAHYEVWQAVGKTLTPEQRATYVATDVSGWRVAAPASLPEF